MRQSAYSIIIPTYNEVENITPLIEEIIEQVDSSSVSLDIVVIDDNSPDGTGKKVLELVDTYPVRLISRESKTGLGSAVREGFAQTDSEYLIVMDADLSHDPSILNAMITALSSFDIVIGSRFLPESTVESWTPWRKFLSKFGVSLARYTVQVQDPLSGYFGFRRHVIDNVQLKTMGYKILFEILTKGTYQSVCEIPFTFRVRHTSVSKLNTKEYLRFLFQCIAYVRWRKKK
ncbi:MAG: hypothetical protein CO030_00025 [Candidatus Magasanikbacteria bacterium CG_4_9_14_0_2_um_filter_42_11]|uniref:Glycosyltransferase 2-like domain-containing protein n=1 Tax=Candidatus Magasanikbacteria bacterium CG_4_9_14_0_2_um_filter_42_11 TaxID=1974643 RepID=A0A2M8FB84_9BACT|nr:MAG: hypothetical protein COU34_03290 [Candidatus Magasanikbacteria bacterium CG10_big_fil_rev_8_21_14_0_10_43_9]PIY92169.1 MAG: hypothetical protein COY70_04695 [Candidatus Magasanikbacteria bacterium CG_4_10_14_0_8_um_filter_42_12]PJC52986.1 MAG: hypothetical protein CO030_00025 [Candidatus Magasanikbacteria bacterium CG_4_9_14_0_2_um_filter_42_11]